MFAERPFNLYWRNLLFTVVSATPKEQFDAAYVSVQFYIWTLNAKNSLKLICNAFEKKTKQSNLPKNKNGITNRTLSLSLHFHSTSIQNCAIFHFYKYLRHVGGVSLDALTTFE